MGCNMELTLGVMHCRDGDTTGQQYREATDAPNVVDGTIPRIESLDDEHLVVLRDLDSGTYVLYGRFVPYAGADATMTFGSSLLVNVLKRTSETHVQVFYPRDNCVQHLKITDTDYTRTDVYLNDLAAAST